VTLPMIMTLNMATCAIEMERLSTRGFDCWNIFLVTIRLTPCCEDEGCVQDVVNQDRDLDSQGIKESMGAHLAWLVR
jgi:hypothetical protein